MTGISPAALVALIGGDTENFLVAATPGGIERQEAEGQRALVSSFNRLPTLLRSPNDPFYFREGEDPLNSNGWDVAKALGFTFTDEGSDDIFQGVVAPEGWQLRPTDHSMHSDIVDDKGRVRGGVFYKAAFYDRNAHGDWHTRFRISSRYPEDHNDRSQTRVVEDRQTGEIMFERHVPGFYGRTEEPIDGLVSYDEYSELQAKADEEAKAWLTANYPDYENVLAYWE